MPISSGIHWLYMVQMGFYLHCAYATIYLETIRRDFVVLMLHHLLTLGLLMFSYVVRWVGGARVYCYDGITTIESTQ